MRVYEFPNGLQFWTFAGSHGVTRTGRRWRQKVTPILLWDYSAVHGYQELERKVAASFLRTMRPDLKKVLDQ